MTSPLTPYRSGLFGSLTTVVGRVLFATAWGAMLMLIAGGVSLLRLLSGLPRNPVPDGFFAIAVAAGLALVSYGLLCTLAAMAHGVLEAAGRSGASRQPEAGEPAQQRTPALLGLHTPATFPGLVLCVLGCGAILAGVAGGRFIYVVFAQELLGNAPSFVPEFLDVDPYTGIFLVSAGAGCLVASYGVLCAVVSMAYEIVRLSPDRTGLGAMPRGRGEAGAVAPPAALPARRESSSEPVAAKAIQVVGRDATCDVRLDDSSVSRQHADVEQLADGRLRITDRGSANGTFVMLDGEWRAFKQADVDPSARLRLGTREVVAGDLHRR